MHAQDATTFPMPQSTRDTFGHRNGRGFLLMALVFLTVAGVVTVLLLSHGVPDVWWPHTGHAFSSPSGTAAHNDPCGLILGPAREYCRRGGNAARRGPTLHGLLRLAAAGLGIAVLLYLRRRRQS
ncbi:hypothetical protein AQI95_41920 [Streptomyces yokosukanensis]|uniref:Uncharacterized protein n=1 Tax=Streptomyces yokosukanensis TaxID=67386 RepID=A0A101NQ62_9ACTN|nr:hypothetical protein AQI95_41920 [Streptomyces yokosukanensis]